MQTIGGEPRSKVLRRAKLDKSELPIFMREKR
jgi:hypothetical protein